MHIPFAHCICTVSGCLGAVVLCHGIGMQVFLLHCVTAALGIREVVPRHNLGMAGLSTAQTAQSHAYYYAYKGMVVLANAGHVVVCTRTRTQEHM